MSNRHIPCLHLKINTASYKITVSVNDTTVEMEIDTGAAFSVISEDTYKHLCSQSKLPSPPPPLNILEWYFKHTQQRQ